MPKKQNIGSVIELEFQVWYYPHKRRFSFSFSYSNHKGETEECDISFGSCARKVGLVEVNMTIFSELKKHKKD